MNKRRILALWGVSVAYCLGNGRAEVPSDVKRSQIHLEKGQVEMHRANFALNAGMGASSSSYRPESYQFKNAELKLGTKFILGKNYEDGAIGFALAPDLNVKLRLDDTGKKLRLEAGGKLVSALDVQLIFAKNYLKPRESDNIWQEIDNDREEVRKLEQEIAEDKKNNQLSPEKITKLNFYKNKIDNNNKLLILDEEARRNPKAYATLDFSFVNLGPKYKEIADALYKFAGVTGGLFSLSFDLAAKSKSGNIKAGVCGVVDLVTWNIGQYKTAVGEHKTTTYGASASVCTKFAIGPVSLTNTVSASVDRSPHFKSSSINNTARLGVKTEAIPAVIAEIGAFHTYNKEYYPGGEIDSNTIGAGITVLAK